MTTELPLSDEALWSLADRGRDELERHLARHPADRARAAALLDAIDGIRAGAVPAAEPAPSVRGYRVVRVLGRGGMGVVYEARQETPERAVALKVLRAGAVDARAVSRFRREVAALARLEHPSIATMLDAGTADDGAPWYTMRLVRGRPLVEHAREHALDRRARIALLADVCDAVEFAHRAGVVHRDLKPANVLVDPECGPVVLDFGLARLREDVERTLLTESGAGTFLGTLAYMAPEQARGEPADERSDVYALGAMLHELLLGRTPHEVERVPLVEGVRRVAETEPPRPRTHDRALAADLETILGTALARDRSRRYASARALAEDLRRFLEGRPILARPPSLGYRASRFAARHWLGLLATALALACVLLVLSSSVNALRVRLFRLGGSWWREAVPYEELRWSSHVPQVRLGGQWYDLLAIDDLQTAYVLGFTRQEAGDQWRKRFSEDLVQVLNQMGDWCLVEVDLLLRDLATGEIVERRGVPLDDASRRAIWRDRHVWPFEESGTPGGGARVRFEGREWELVSLEGHPASEIARGQDDASELDLYELYDDYVDATGDSPPPRVDFVLRDPATGELRAFEDVERDATRRP